MSRPDQLTYNGEGVHLADVVSMLLPFTTVDTFTFTFVFSP